MRCTSSFKAIAATLALMLCLAVGVASAFPAQAHATFKDVADSYPAAQDLGSYGDPIKGSQLPDGAYKVTARTTSRMCIMYTDPANADARDSKEQAIISVNGGQMTAVFYISKAYTHLYFGTQEQAAKATNAKGTDASAYIAGDPDEGYIPHMFAIPISALNTPITISTYSGGDKGLEKGKWYTRQVVFKMTDAEFKAATEPAQEPEPSQGASQQSAQAPSPESAPASDGASDAAVNAKSEESAEPKEDEKAKSSDSSAKSGSSEKPQANLNTGNVVADGSGSQDANQGWTQETVAPSPQLEPSEQSAEPSDQSSTSAAPATASPSTIRGVRMSISNPQIEIDVPETQAPAEEEEQKPLLTLPQIVGLVVMCLFVVGIAARCLLFTQGMDQARKSR